MKFHIAKDLTAMEILKLLQEYTKSNIEKIKINNEKAEKLKSDGKIAHQGAKIMKQYYINNGILYKQNNLYIELHTRLLCFIKSLKVSMDETASEDIEEKKDIETLEYNFNDYFDLTTQGLISYNEQHPYYNNKVFRQNLVDFYAEKEDYEKCAILLSNNYTIIFN